MLRLGSTVLGASDVRRATEFWARALGYVPRDEVIDERFVVLAPTDGVGQNVSLMRSETPPQDRPRVHLDLYADDPAAEVERLLELGASRVDWQDYPPDADFTVLADTEGNRFCVIDKAG
ncbi:VOC family protein [Actinophytocola sp.]|uniref:VOC family protein n=1 Tax=Actinophytocola sp. TaxID=1872138 RepID=UPI00389A9CFF